MQLKQYLKHTLFALGFLWVGIVNLLFYICWFYWMKRKGTFEKIEWDWNSWSWKCDVANNSDFYKNAMQGWWGFVIGSFIIFVDKDTDPKHMKHEETHVLQNYIFGPLFYPVYELLSIVLLIFAGTDCHSYYDNPFEVWARRSAGQQIKIPRSEWSWGPNDRWPWW